MGKKSLIATVVGVIGGLAFGFAAGYYYAFAYLSGEIINLIRDIAGPQYARAGEVIGQALVIELANYTSESNSTMVLGFLIGGLIIVLALIIAYKTGETSWIPWRKKKEE